jgi:hypothetical protein
MPTDTDDAEKDQSPEDGIRFTHKCPVCGFEWSITFPTGSEVAATVGTECERCRDQQPTILPT